jgi:two-component system chemotaxis response regulator CheY
MFKSIEYKRCGETLCAATTRGRAATTRSGEIEGAMAVDLTMPVLVVDDYNTMIRIIRNLLRQVGFTQVDDACDGASALKLMRAKRYGLIISDWNMEPMTGYDLLKEVRSDPVIGDTPFIMVTAESRTENVIAAKQAGVSNAQTLKSKIEAVFAEQAPTAA